MTDSDDRSRDRDIYLPPPPSSDEGPAEEIKVPRVNPPSRALESYAKGKPRDSERRAIDVGMLIVVVIALAAGLAYLFR